MLTNRKVRLPFIFTALLATFIATDAVAEHTDDSPQLKPFTAHYKTEWKLGWFSIDIEASRTLRKLSNGHWQLVFDADSSAAGLTETSEFELADGQIYPLEYRYRATGLISEDDRTLIFAPELKMVRDLEKDKKYTQAWDNSVQDNLTYMVQAGLDLAAGKEQLNYEVFEKKRSKDFEFKVLGEEKLQTRIGEIKTIKVKQIRKDKNREIYAWFAPEYNYQLIRLVDKEDGKTRYHIDITAIN